MNLDSILGIHEKALELSGKRTEVLASNLANADTPGYQARDIDFKEIMSSIGNKDHTNLVVTNPLHINDSEDVMAASLKYRVPLQTKLDGNTVDAQIESGKFAENSMRHIASLRFLDTKIKNFMIGVRGE
jgi:flagellar basal-body rod protein FlgB